jgi:hypothetical protein
MKFVRYGGIKSVSQKHFGEYDSFHSPPTKNGFYAMPHKAQEFFLIGCIDETQPHLFPKKPYSETVWNKWKDIINDIPDVFDRETGMNITEYPKEYTEEMEEARKKYNQRMRDIRKEFTLKDEDIIWHHLENMLPNNEIIQRHGSWVSSRVKEYKKAFKKEIARLKYNKKFTPFGYSKDHFEVFITFNI